MGVYDGSGLFLGYLTFADVTRENPQILGVFNPDISTFFKVDVSPWPNPVLQPINYHFDITAIQFYFTSGDCTGQSYVTTMSGIYSIHGLYFDSLTNKLYVFDPQVPVASFYDLHSAKYNGICTPDAYGPENDPLSMFPIKEITFPLFYQTLQHPIVVKPIQ